jgi:DNA-directed RNA polymerase subunit K/omega
MVDELHVHIGNRTMKPLVIAISEMERGAREEMEGMI